MPVSTTARGTPIWRLRTTRAQWLGYLAWLFGLCLFLLCWKVISDNTMWVFVEDAGRQGSDLIRRMMPPEWQFAQQLWKPMWDTLNIATLGTLLGIAMAFPVAFLAARNTTPHPLIRSLAMVIIVASRSINSLIWAMLLVTILGPGVLAGIIAIALRSIGFVGKLLYEAIEEIHPTPVEAISATGASRLQVMNYGVLPQVMPAFAGISIYRWDINIRESTVLGLVGAGGIGLQLNASINSLAWDQVSVIFVMIFATVLVSEWISARVRHAVI
ncbi:phosphonate ABC transporter, permease protein PhnE [Halomonas urumqiensis]|uniref:Phosphonate ABC transporter, permease protein PhnE n=1 Tax=Halomonas urumqiensis TaxID=1684789 RepID=A0A2N7UEX7_9GAMM|nr:phosphonate ABC transporter, permease protein PhnE [Halomonas urumqiensis]PMR79009.1 phosphonate ABC transporter, permease protein PhnE [Halomonas urumqiensis]PTB01003.1 phosphonate ABC transporter, permease protein PhnE [Halomonas urumqiensis]GHE22948.1 phosphonate ABC transporter, permease protein PhnE [Halomonas urumqiensis]